MRRGFLTLLLNVTSRLLIHRDRMNGIMEQMLGAFSFPKERLVIPSGRRRLSAVYVSAGEETPAVVVPERLPRPGMQTAIRCGRSR